MLASPFCSLSCSLGESPRLRVCGAFADILDCTSRIRATEPSPICALRRSMMAPLAAMMSAAAPPGAEMTSVRPSLPPVNLTGVEIFAQRSPTIWGQCFSNIAAEDPAWNFLERGRTTLATAIPAVGAGRNWGRPRWLSSHLLRVCLFLRVSSTALNDLLNRARKEATPVLE